MGGGRMPSVTIVGCGPGSRDFASRAALQAIAQADLLLGARRLLDEFGETGNTVHYTSVRDTLQTIRDNSGKNVVILVTGDPGFFSITACIIREFGNENVTVIPGISSMTYAFDRLGLSWHDAVFVSAHREMPPDFAETAAAAKKIGILTSPSNTPAILAAAINADVVAGRRFYVGERLSYPDEKLREYTYRQVCGLKTDELSVLIIVRQEEG